MAAPPLLPRHLPWVIERPCEPGGLAERWVARSRESQARAIVALLPSDILPQVIRPMLAVWLEEGFDIQARLQGAGAPAVLERGATLDGRPFAIVELAEGETLARVLARAGRLSIEETTRIVVELARVLGRVHAIAAVHGDVRPETILVRGELGLAEARSPYRVPSRPPLEVTLLSFDNASRAPPSPHTRLGAPRLLSPEHLRGVPVDARADLWAIGVIGFLCATGRYPYEAQALPDLIARILDRDAPAPSDVVPGLPAWFDRWFQRANAKDRDARFQTAHDVAAPFLPS